MAVQRTSWPGRGRRRWQSRRVSWVTQWGVAWVVVPLGVSLLPWQFPVGAAFGIPLIVAGGVHAWRSRSKRRSAASDSIQTVRDRLDTWYQEDLSEALRNISKPLPLRIRIKHAEETAVKPMLAGENDADSGHTLSVEELGQHISESTPCALLRGAGGSGKSTLLIQLSLLMLRSDHAGDVPRLPFVVSLGSWKDSSYGDFEEWLLDRLEDDYYRVPPDFGRSLLDQCQVTLLLDGFEVVEDSARTGLLLSVEEFRKKRGLLPIIMACRSGDYEPAQSPIFFDHTFDLELPSREEAANFLSMLGNPVAEDALQVSRRDKTWWNLLRTPLVLSLIARIGAEEPSAQVVISGSRSRRLNHLIDTYIEVMLKDVLKRKKSPYADREVCDIDREVSDIRASLAWLAAKMTATGRSDLTADHFDLSWIEDGSLARRATYMPAVLSVLPLGMFSAGMFLSWTAILPGVNGFQLSFILIFTFFEFPELRYKASTTTSIYESKKLNPVTHVSFSTYTGKLLAVALLAGVTITFASYINNHFSITVSWLAVGVTVTSVYLLSSFMTSTEITSDDEGRAPLELLRKSRRLAWIWSLPISLGTALIAIAIHWYVNALPTGLVVGGILFSSLWPLLWVTFGGGAWLEYRGCNRILRRQGVFPCTIDKVLNLAADSLVMARLGTSFRFVHQWVQDRLAAKYQPARSEDTSGVGHRPT